MNRKERRAWDNTPLIIRSLVTEEMSLHVKQTLHSQSRRKRNLQFEEWVMEGYPLEAAAVICQMRISAVDKFDYIATACLNGARRMVEEGNSQMAFLYGSMAITVSYEAQNPLKSSK